MKNILITIIFVLLSLHSVCQTTDTVKVRMLIGDNITNAVTSINGWAVTLTLGKQSKVIEYLDENKKTLRDKTIWQIVRI